MSENRCASCNEVIPEGGMVCYKCNYISSTTNTSKIIVLLDNLADVQKFTSLVSRCQKDVVVKSGNSLINAKLLMGLLSLNLTKPIKVEFYGDIPYEIRREINKFIVN